MKEASIQIFFLGRTNPNFSFPYQGNELAFHNGSPSQHASHQGQIQPMNGQPMSYHHNNVAGSVQFQQQSPPTDYSPNNNSGMMYQSSRLIVQWNNDRHGAAHWTFLLLLFQHPLFFFWCGMILIRRPHFLLHAPRLSLPAIESPLSYATTTVCVGFFVVVALVHRFPLLQNIQTSLRWAFN